MIGHLLHIPRRALLFAVYFALGAAVLFVALTRTRVGRDGLRFEIERQFARHFEGRLSIGVLEGNLVNDLFAGTVTLYDPDGRPVAVIDSVLIEPDWTDLFHRSVSLGTVTLQRPRLRLHVDSSGTWNLASALRRRRPPSPEATPWAFSGAAIQVVDGQVITTRDGPPPPPVHEGRVFDYTRADLRAIEADLTLEWGPGRLLVDVQRLSARSDTLGLTLDALNGQLARTGETWAVNDLDLQLGATTLSLNGTARSLSGWSAEALREAVFDLDLESPRLAWNELRRLLPALPLDDGLSATLRVHGPLYGLVLETLDLRRGRSRLAVEGSVLGWPDSLDVELDWRRTRLAPADVRAVWPGAPVDALRRLGVTQANVLTRGRLRGPANARSVLAWIEGQVQTEAGTLVGRVHVERDDDALPTYDLDVQATRLDLGRLLNRPSLASTLAGRLRLTGSGDDPERLAADASLRLGPSRIAGRRLDSLYLDVRARQGQYTASGAARSAGSVVQASTALAWNAAYPTYASQVRLNAVDLGPLLQRDSLQTRLTAVLDVRGGGRSWSTLQGRAILTMDTSLVARNGVARTVPAHTTTLDVQGQGTDGPRLRIGGDVLDATVDGPVAPDVLAALGRLWLDGLREALRRDVQKPYPRRVAAVPDSGREPPSSFLWQVGTEQERLDAARLLTRASPDAPLRITARVHLLRSDILSALLPPGPLLHTDLNATLTASVDTDSLHLSGRITADSLDLGTAARLDSLEGTWTLSSRWRAGGPPAVEAAATVSAAHLHAGRQTLYAPALELASDPGGARLRVWTDDVPGGVVVRGDATLTLLPDRNRLILSDLLIGVESYTWTAPQPGRIDLYDGAAVVHDVTLTAPSTLVDAAQRLTLTGAVSPLPEDTLFAEIDDLVLRQVSALAGLPRPVGGRLNGRVALTGGLRQPTLSGRLGVDALALDDRLLGGVEVTSRLLPEGGIALDAHLRPLPPDSIAALLARSPLLARAEDNDLHLSGTLLFPRFAAGAMIDEGALNLTLEAPRIDPFFFDLLFDIVQDADGRITGRGTIGGTFRRPLFDARMRLEEGRVQIPRFNLRYALSGGIDVTADGFVLHDVQVTDPAGGQARLDGRILFNDYAYFSFDLDGRLDRLQIMNVPRSDDLPFYGRIAASGQIRLEGPTYQARLQSFDARTTPDSEIFIPVVSSNEVADAGYIIFADSTGRLPDLRRLTRRSNILAQRPVGERTFIDGLEMDLNIQAPRTSVVHLVIDPLLGDVINAVGGGRLQIQRQEGEFLTFGTLEVEAGDYLFTAGEVFVRRFLIEDGTITWDGDPTNPLLDIRAAYRTRASRAGLPGEVGNSPGLIPLVVQLHITGRTESPVVDLSLAVDRSDRDVIRGYEGLEAVLNQPERSTEYATSVLLTNSFLLTTDLASGTAGQTGERLAFNSLSQLVGNQLNRYINQAIPNLDVNLGLQTGATSEDLGLTYGVALRLLDERLIIRGQGVVDNNQQETRQQAFTVEIRLSPRVSVEVFHRREGDAFTFDETTSTTGAGISYQTLFSNWRQFFRRLFGWPGSDAPAAPPSPAPPPAPEPAAGDLPPASPSDSTTAFIVIPFHHPFIHEQVTLPQTDPARHPAPAP